MADMKGDAKVIIKIEVNDSEANAKLTRLGQKMRDLDGKNRTSKRSLDDVGKSLENTAKKAKDADEKFNWFGKRLNQLEKELKGTGTALKSFGAALSGIFKIVKYGAMEFGAMTLALGAMSLAFKTGQILARGWAKAVQVASGAAGVAVAAIATALGAMRELQVAQMKPLYTGPNGLASNMSGIMGNKQLAMYGESLQAIMAQQMKVTGRVDAQFQQRLTRMADFAMGDPKQLQAIAAAFSEMQKQGKVTTDVYSQLQSASPALAKAFEELAGGQKKAAGAAAAGKIGFHEFEKAMLAGKLKALEPYNGALEAINDTLIGRLKGTLVTVKEDLTQLGVGFLDMMKGPLSKVEQDLRTFVMKIAPTIKNVFPQIFGNAANDAEGLLGGALNKMATLIITNMPKLVGMGQSMAETWGRFKDIIRTIGDYLGRFVEPFSLLWNTILKPLGQELVTTINYALTSFTDMVGKNADTMLSWGESIRGIFAGLRGVIDMLASFKQMIQPLVTGLLRMLGLFGEMFGGGGPLSGLLKWVGQFGILLLVFKKFITSLGVVKQNVNGFGQMLKNIRAGEDLTKKATDGATNAINGQTAAMERLLVVMQEMLYIQRQMAGVPGGWSMNSMGVVMPPGLQQRMLQGAGPTSPFPGPGTTGPTNPAAKQQAKIMGGVFSKEFANSKVGKAMVGAGVVAGMVGPMLGGYLSGKFEATNKGGQALASGISGLGTGAAIGATFGPMGAAAGAVIGGALGAFSGWLGANKEQERRRAQGRAAAQQQVQGALGSGNRLSDYMNAAAAARAGQAELEMLFGSGNTEIENLKTGKTKAIKDLWSDFSSFATKELIAQGKLDAGKELQFLKTGESTGVKDAYGADITNMGRDAFFVKGESTAFSLGGDTADVELNAVEQLAQKYAMEKFDYTKEEVERMTTGHGDGKNAFFLEDIVGGDYDAQIAAATKAMDELKAKYGDATAANNQYKDELAKLAEQQKAFGRNMDNAVFDLGLNADDVSAVFDELGLKLSESGVGIHEFNKILGYTGNEAADAALGLGRLRDALTTDIEGRMASADAANRRDEQVIRFLETRGKPIEQNDAVKIAGETSNAILDDFIAKVNSKEMKFEQAFGGTGSNGMLGLTLARLLSESPDLPPEVIAEMTKNKGDIEKRLAAMKADPFERMKIDSEFKDTFTGQIELAKSKMMEMMRPVAEGGQGLTSSQALAGSTEGLKTWLATQGITVTESMGATLETMVGNTALNSADAITGAFEEGSKMAYDQIRAALGGQRIIQGGNNGRQGVPTTVVPLDPPDTNSPRAGRFGDTASRFQRTMQSHAALNGRFGGRRSVTSGVRDFALGSLNSDHTTGAAFDLTGDNLLAYGKAVRDSGGFAEMHGGTSDRHLHVVPGVGDTYAPQPVAARQAANFSAAPAGPITLNVYGAEGQSVQALADEVMNRLERKQRSNSERS
jgi:hypothetical protein